MVIFIKFDPSTYCRNYRSENVEIGKEIKF